jgi:quercetin dioxygenase-like cupin family protein
MIAVVHPDDVQPMTFPGADVRTTFDARNGCDALQQVIVRFGRGEAQPPPVERGEAVLYVASGRATMELNGETHELEPETAVALKAGDAPTFVNETDDDLVLVCVIAPDSSASNGAPTERVVRFREQPEEEASAERSFRYLVNDGEITQFVGIVQPSKAPFHSHPYDEVGYVVEGNGVAHMDGDELPLRSGSCFHLPPGKIHCIENTGPGVMRIMGVFHPAGSPANRSYQDNI